MGEVYTNLHRRSIQCRENVLITPAKALQGTHKDGFLFAMKTTLEIPDELFRAAESKAAQQGQTFRQFVTDAVQEKLAVRSRLAEVPRWMKYFGAAKGMEDAIREVDAAVERECETIEPESDL